MGMSLDNIIALIKVYAVISTNTYAFYSLVHKLTCCSFPKAVIPNYHRLSGLKQ